MKQKVYGFTLVELMVVVVIIGILASIVAVAYENWSTTTTITQLKSDLKNVASAYKNYVNFNNTYPVSVSTLKSFKASNGTVLTGGGSADGTSYCVSATSSSDPTLLYYVSSANDGVVKEGVCP